MNVIIVVIIFFLVIIVTFGLLLCLDLLMIFDYCSLHWVVYPIRDIDFYLVVKIFYFQLMGCKLLYRSIGIFIIVIISVLLYSSMVT